MLAANQTVIIDSFCLFIEMIHVDAKHNCLTTIKVLSFLLDAVYDIKEWLAPHAEQFHDHAQPKFSGKCGMFYRNYSHMQLEGPTCNCAEGKLMAVMCCNIECIFRIILREKSMLGV